MSSILSGIGRALTLGLLAVLLVSCGGGSGGSDSGGFSTTETNLDVTITAGTNALPLNPFGVGPSRGGSFTTQITVSAFINGRPVDNGTIVQFRIVSGSGSGALFCLLNDPDCVDTDDDGNEFQVAFDSFPFESSGGQASMFLHARGTAGTVTISATVQDPVSGRSESTTVSVLVGPGGGPSSGLPAFISFLTSNAPLYVNNLGQVDILIMQISVTDDAGQPVPNPSGNNVQVELLPGRPGGGETLSAVDALGNNLNGTVVKTRTANGIAQVTLRTGGLPGNVRIAATTDRADNNIDNGIGDPVVDVTTRTIGSGEIRTINFTSPFPGAVAARQNALPLGPFDSISNGVYARLITISTTDQFGQPPPPGTQLTFFLGDGPLTGYPNTGHGTFNITGNDGNPEEGGFLFTAPATGSSFAGAAPGCLLFFQGGRPDREGVRIITGLSAGLRELTVNTPFNNVADLGFTVPYTITCPPTRGNVEAAPDNVIVQTDASGTATTILNYPITDLGRSFCLGAQANGGLAGAVLCGFYLGIADGSSLTLNGQATDLTFSAVVGDMTMQTVTVQLFDGSIPPSPIPAEVLDVLVDIVDPDETDVQNAQLELAAAIARQTAAQTALDEFRATININAGETSETPGVCMSPPDNPNTPNVDESATPPRLLPATCAVLMTLEQNLADAQQAVRDRQSDLADAQARADQFDLIATFQPANGNPGDPIITGANGLVDIKFTVTDMPPNGMVTFTVTTVGPEVIAPSRQVIFTPTMGDGGSTAN